MATKGRLIPVPNLDDRDWRVIKDSLVREIPRRCPEWTDWNVSDPGITLIELFSLGIEELIYRLNQVLPKHMREYLNMIGVTLTPPSVARAVEFFKLSAPQTFDVYLRKGFEIATAGSGDDQAIFTTDRDLTIHAALVYKCLGYQDGAYTDFTPSANDAADTFNPLSGPLAVGDALYLAYQEDNYFERLIVSVETPETGDIEGVWEYYRALPDGMYEWAALVVNDETESFSKTGEITFTIPVDWVPGKVNDIKATWLRFRVTSAPSGAGFAVIRQFRIDEILGRVPVSNAAQIDAEVLGSSSGNPDQRFYLSNVPVLDMKLLVDEGQGFQQWQEVEDFTMSMPTDRHYLLNPGTGEVLFGDGIKGKVPAAGKDNVKAAPYRYGGGSRGNVGAYTIDQLRSSHVYIDSCVNKEAAKGGGDEETVEQAIERGPTEQLKTRNRAVTNEDFETLTLESSTGIARAKTLPLFDPANPEVEAPGVVSIIAMPRGGGSLSAALRDAIREYLDIRRLVTAQLHVIDPEYITVDVNATVAKTGEASTSLLEDKVKAVIKEFLDPEYGGDAQKAVDYVEGIAIERGSGWEFGRDIYLSELYELMERIPGVDHVEAIIEPVANLAIEKNQLPLVGTVSVTVL
jgi:Baseplate J-like protein